MRIPDMSSAGAFQLNFKASPTCPGGAQQYHIHMLPFGSLNSSSQLERCTEDDLVDLAALSDPLRVLERAGFRVASCQAGRSAHLGLSSLTRVLRARVITSSQTPGVHAYHRQDCPSDEIWVSQPVKSIETLTTQHVVVARMCFDDAADEVNLNNKNVIRKAASLLHALDNTFGHMLDDASGSICRTKQLLGSHCASLLVSAKPLVRSLDLADFIDACVHYQERGLAAIMEHLCINVQEFAMATLDSWANSKSSDISEGQLWCLEKIFARFAAPVEQPGPQQAQYSLSPLWAFSNTSTSDGAAPRYTLQTPEALKAAACCTIPHLNFMDHNWDQIHSVFGLGTGNAEGPGIAEFVELCVWLKAHGPYYLGTQPFADLEVGGWLADLTKMGWLTSDELLETMVGRIMDQLTSVSDGIRGMCSGIFESRVGSVNSAQRALRAVPGMTKERAEALSRTVVQNANETHLTREVIQAGSCIRQYVRQGTGVVGNAVLHPQASAVQAATMRKGLLRTRVNKHVRKALAWRAEAGSGPRQATTYGSQAAAVENSDEFHLKTVEDVRREITAGLRARVDAREELHLSRRKEALARQELMCRDNLVLMAVGGLLSEGEEEEGVAEGKIAAASPTQLDKGGPVLKPLQAPDDELEDILVESSFVPTCSQVSHPEEQSVPRPSHLGVSHADERTEDNQTVDSPEGGQRQREEHTYTLRRRPNQWRHHLLFATMLQGEEQAGHPVSIMAPKAQAAAEAVAEVRMRALAEEAERARMQSLPVAIVEAEAEAKAKESERALLDSRALADAQAHTLAQLLKRAEGESRGLHTVDVEL